MMVTIEFLGPINKDDIVVDINNLSQLSEILKNEDDVSTWLESCAVAVNDTLVSSKDIELKDGDKVSLLPPVCGG
jgi:sulfur-carrier protein